jgi:hypothetical protein
MSVRRTSNKNALLAASGNQNGDGNASSWSPQPGALAAARPATRLGPRPRPRTRKCSGAYNTRVEKSDGGLQQIECWHCLRCGHKKDECRTKKKSEEARAKGASKRTVGAGITQVEGRMATVGQTNTSRRNRMIDSGATDHLYSNRARYTSLRIPQRPSPVPYGQQKGHKTNRNRTAGIATGQNGGVTGEKREYHGVTIRDLISGSFR